MLIYALPLDWRAQIRHRRRLRTLAYLTLLGSVSNVAVVQQHYVCGMVTLLDGFRISRCPL